MFDQNHQIVWDETELLEARKSAKVNAKKLKIIEFYWYSLMNLTKPFHAVLPKNIQN